MQRLPHRFKLGEPAVAARVAHLGGEVADGVVAPVVGESLLHQVMVVDEGVHRHQLDRGHAEAAQMLEDGRSGERGVLAAQSLRHVGMLHGESLDVQLVDERVVPRRRRSAIFAPGERGIDDLALRHAEGVVALVWREVFALAADAVAEMTIAPAQVAHDRLGVGIEEKLLRIEAKALRWIVRALDAGTVEKPGARVGQIAMPHLVGLLAKLDALYFAAPLGIEQAQLDAFGLLREEREVHALPVPGRAQRMGPPRPDGRTHSTGFEGPRADGSSRSGGRDQRSIKSPARFCPPSPKAIASPSAIAATMIRNACRMMSPTFIWSSAIMITNTMMA